MNKLKQLLESSEKGYIIKSSVLPVVMVLLFICAGISFHHFFVYEPQKRVETAQQLIKDKEYAQAADLLYDFTYKGYNKNNKELKKVCKNRSELKLYTLKVGDKVTYGKYKQKNKKSKAEKIEWYVIYKENGKLLLQSVKVLESKPINKKDAGNNFSGKWEYSTLRDWLNTSFYDSAFSDVEKSLIVEDEKDMVSILASDDDFTFTKDKKQIEDGRAKPTEYVKKKGLTVNKDGKSPVWTKTEFSKNSNKYYVVFKNSKDGREVTKSYGIRPVIWVEVAPLTDKTDKEGEKK